MRYLVVHDVDAIQEYIFATGRLREIRGASALIDQINHRETGRLIGKYRGQRIYVGGGGAAADFADRGQAEDFSAEVSEVYLARTTIVSSTGVVEPYDEVASTSFRSALRNAHFHLRQKKAGRQRQTQVLSSPYFKLCQSCGIHPVVSHDPRWPEEEGRFVCRACDAKRRMSRYPHGPFIHRYVCREVHKSLDISPEFPQKIEQVADPNGYIGVIYSDGNRMGDHLQQLETETELKQFSRTVDWATKKTIADILVKRYGERSREGNRLPVLVPLCGGDDLVVIVPGQDALEVAIDYLKGVQERVRSSLGDAVAQKIGGKEISACAGIALAKDRTPLVALLDLAHQLCRSAKARSYEFSHPFPGQSSQEIPCLDFQVITTPSWRRLQEVRTTEYLLDSQTRLTARPYTVDEAERLVEAVRVLKREQFSPGKLHDLYRGLRMGRNQAVFRYLALSMRARENQDGPMQHSALREVATLLGVEPDLSVGTLSAPWQPWSGPRRGANWAQTPYGDVMEIYAFVPV